MLATVADPAAVLVAVWVVVSPVHQSAEVVPFIHTAKPNPVPNAKRYPVGEINVVGDKQRLPPRQLQDEALVPGILVVIRQ
jgi:hypothetical protein